MQEEITYPAPSRIKKEQVVEMDLDVLFSYVVHYLEQAANAIENDAKKENRLGDLEDLAASLKKYLPPLPDRHMTKLQSIERTAIVYTIGLTLSNHKGFLEGLKQNCLDHIGTDKSEELIACFTHAGAFGYKMDDVLRMDLAVYYDDLTDMCASVLTRVDP